MRWFALRRDNEDVATDGDAGPPYVLWRKGGSLGQSIESRAKLPARGSLMRDVYACSFALEAGADPRATLRAVSRAVLDWVFEHTDHAPRDWVINRGRWEASGDYADWMTLAAAEVPDELWTLTFFHTDRTDQTLGWRSSIQVASEDGELRFLMRLAIEPLQLRILPARYEVGRPRIIRTVAREFGAHMDGRPLLPEAWRVTSSGVPALVELLLSPSRRLPVVVVTAHSETGRAVVDERKLAGQLVGLAHLAYVAPASATYELTDRIGKPLSVFGGAIRVYWPGLTQQSDPFDHRLWMPERLAVMEDSRVPFSRRLMRLLTSVAVLRVPADPLGRKLRHLADAAQRREVEELRRKLDAAPDELTEQFWADYQATVDRESLLLERVAELEADLAAQQQAFGELAREYAAGGEPDELLTDEAEILTVRDAVDAVAAEYDDCLVFLPEALESADESQYPNVAKLHAALRIVGDVARRWRAGTLSAGFATAFRDAGLDFGADVSDVTAGRERGQYDRRYRDHSIRLGPHIKLGRGTSAGNLARIYWWVDEDHKQIVVGHVGKHLPDGTT